MVQIFGGRFSQWRVAESAPDPRLKVLVLCYEYPPIGGGGGRVAKAVAEKLASRGHEVRVQTAGMPHLPRVEPVNGVEVHRARSFRRREDRCSVGEMALFVATSFWPALRQCETWNPDVIHAHFAVPTGALAYAVSLLTSVPYVLTVHLGDVPGGFPDQTDALFRYAKPFTVPIWRRAAGISAVSAHVRDLSVRAYEIPVEKILNGLEIRCADRSHIMLQTPRRLVFAGRFVSQKNVPLIVDALAEVRDLEWHATLIGDGPLMPEVCDRIALHGLGGRVDLPGWQEADEVERTMAASDIFLIPSTHEGLPVAAVQALHCGLAIVGTAIGGLADVVIDDVNGILLATHDKDALGAALRRLLGDDATLLRMRNASREHGRLFDLDAITTQYENLLNAAIVRSHARSR